MDISKPIKKVVLKIIKSSKVKFADKNRKRK